MQRAGRSDDLCSSSAAGVSSRGVSSLAVRWKDNVVNNISPMISGLSFKSFT